MSYHIIKPWSNILTENSNPLLTIDTSGGYNIRVGERFTSPSYFAQDSRGNDISHRVIIDSEVNNRISGTYPVTYSVKDSTGNETVQTIYVQVSPRSVKLQGTVKPIEQIVEGEAFTLDASGSVGATSYQWSQVSGKRIEISSPNKAKTSQVITEVDFRELVTFKLVISNEEESETLFLSTYIVPNPELDSNLNEGIYRKVVNVEVELPKR